MDTYQRIAYGLKMVFWTKLLQTLCEFLPPIVFLAGWIFASDLLMETLYFFYFGRILFPALCAVNLYGMKNDIGACKKAAVLCFADAVALVIRFVVHADRIDHVSYIMYFAAEEGMSMYDEYLEGAAAWIDLIASIVHCVAPLLVVYFICTSVSAVMKELGEDERAKFGRVVWIMQLVTGIAYMIVLFLPVSFFTDRSRFLCFVAAIFYLRFLYRSYQVFDAQDRKEEET